MSEDIFDLALRSTIDPSTQAALAEQIVGLRSELRRQIAEDDLAETVVFFDFDLYNDQATIAENLFFGKPLPPVSTNGLLMALPDIEIILRDIGLENELYEVGFEIAENIIELFRGLPPHHPFFQQLTFITAAELPHFSSLVQKYRGLSANTVPAKDRMSIVSLSFSYLEPRHRFGILSADLRRKVVAARKQLHVSFPDAMNGVLDRFDPGRFAASASLLDNALFGRVAHQFESVAVDFLAYQRFPSFSVAGR